MEEITFSAEELSALQAVFCLYDKESSGYIDTKHFEDILEKIGRNRSDAETLLSGFEKDSMSLNEFLELLQRSEGLGVEVGADPKVVEFISILEEYRAKCESDGNYLEAQRADGQLVILRKQEAKRQSKSLKARQIAERQDVQIAHNIQFNDFNGAWDQYLDEYDEMAQSYVKQMSDKHANELRVYQEKLHKEIMDRPPKFSKELMEWRRRQHLLARQKKYAEAQKIKQIADTIEEKERSRMNDDYKIVFERKETKFRQQQQSEIQALLKRIDGRRKEHIKQRNSDSKRLLQRNRNVQSVLESKQAVETVKKIADIKSSLITKERSSRSNRNTIPDEARIVKKSLSTSNSSQIIVPK